MLLQQCGPRALPYVRFVHSLVQGNGRFSTIGLRATQSQRCYSTAGPDAKDVAPSAAVASTAGQATSGQPKRSVGLTDHKVNKLEKIFLVWGGKYKAVADVPDFVSQSTLERARNKARIKINIMMAVATLLGCMLMVMSGKKAQKEGETVVKMNEDWHRKLKEESKQTEK